LFNEYFEKSKIEHNSSPRRAKLSIKKHWQHIFSEKAKLYNVIFYLFLNIYFMDVFLI